MATPMKFWGVEIKANEPFQVNLEEGCMIHLSQATLSDTMKDNETVTVHVKAGEKTLVLGMLSQNTPLLSFNLYFNIDFELSHDWKNGSIHLMGCELGELASSDEEDDAPILMEDGIPAAVAALAEENDESEDSESTEDEEGDGEDDAVEADEETGKSDSDEDEDEDDSDDVEDETPEKAVAGKKRPNAKTPPQSKKAKITSTPNSTNKGDETSKSGGNEVICVPCKRTFKSDFAFQSHSKDKHGAK